MSLDQHKREALALISAARTNLTSLRELAGEGDARDEHDPDVLNAAFQAVHPLASVLSLIQNETRDQAVSIGHVLCNRLDDFRMAKLPLTAVKLGAAIEAVDLLEGWVETPAKVEAPTFEAMQRTLTQLGS